MSVTVPRAESPPAGALGELLAKLAEHEPALAADERIVVERLYRLARRLEQERFQLAVVGQFKRGKSTLLNTLLGEAVLPTGVVPLTAVATFLVNGDRPRLDVGFKDGSSQQFEAISIPALRERLAEFVTETQNPHNARNVAAVQVTVSASLLADGLVVIDTPGIGSAERHNSEAAVATLPECDAALIVLSPDPPITEAEIDYLEKIRTQAAVLMPVLNKIDLVAGAERKALIAYVAGVLERVGVTEPLSVVAAGAALPTGIAELQQRLRGLAANRKRVLEEAAALKFKGELSELRFQNDVALAALQLPLGELDAKLAAIALATDRIVGEQRIASDLTGGERQRLLDRIDKEAQTIRERVVRELGPKVEMAAQVNDAFEAFEQIAHASSGIFEREYRVLARAAHESLEAIAVRASERIVPSLERVRKIAAEELGIPFQVPPVEIETRPPRVLAWRERPADSMNPLPPGIVDRVIPEGWRKRRRQARLARELERLVTLNTEHLRWTLRQQVDDILRGFDRDLDLHLRQATASIVALADQACVVRSGAAGRTSAAIAARERRAQLLAAAAEIT